MDPVPDAEEIAAWQADWNLPPAELARVVRKATGSSVDGSERILEGHGHEVHAVATSSGEGVVVRVAWREGPAFDRERWPTAAARAAGVPAPRQLLIEHTAVGGRPVSIDVQERLPGSSIARALPTLEDARLRSLTDQAGELLAAVHAIQVDGAGALDDQGRVDSSLGGTWSPERDLAHRSTELAAHGVDPALVERADEARRRLPAMIDRAPACLVHGDWTLANLLTDGERITGVVDWEGAGGGDPASELRGWDLWHDAGPTSSDRLLEAYGRAGGPLDEDFAHRRVLHRLANLLDALSHFLFTKRDDLLSRATEELQITLRQAQSFR